MEWNEERLSAITGYHKAFSPDRFVETLRLSEGFSDDELRKLAHIPWTEKQIRYESEPQWYGLPRSILFPHVEGVRVPTLFKAFGTDPRRQPCFREDDGSGGTRTNTCRSPRGAIRPDGEWFGPSRNLIRSAPDG